MTGTMTVTIKDIAKIAQVSASTVSRALQGHPRISEMTKVRIRDLAYELGYVPSAVARNLVAKRTATIGIAIPDFGDPFQAGQIKGIDDAAAAHGFRALVTSFYGDPEREAAIVRDFHEKRMEGIIIPLSCNAPAYSRNDPSLFLPIVLMGRPAYHASVSVDWFSGAKAAVWHLAGLGHERIAYVRGHNIAADAERYRAYRESLDELGLFFDESLVLAGNEKIPGGIGAAHELMNLRRPPTAVFCFNDLTAIGVINGLREQGLDVPRDMSVVGYDDLNIAAFYSPKLTTVRQPSYRLGQQAFALLLDLIVGEKKEVGPVIVAPELVVRASTDAPRSMRSEGSA